MINEDIYNALKILKDGTSNKFSKYNKLYLFATENINGYIKYVNGKRILSVCGSGDQAISFILNNPNIITVFDINLLSQYLLFLKIEIIKQCNYKDFLSFFIFNPFDYEIFKKIKMDNNLYVFWNEIYKFVNFDGNKLYNSELFIKNDNEFYFRNIPYLNKINYEIIKNNILNVEIKFINCQLYELLSKLNNIQDNIYLSNISDYLSDIIKFNIYINQIKDKYKCKIIMSYLYDFYKKDKYINNINNPDWISCNIDNYKLYSFNGAYINTIDYILVKE